MPANNKRRYLYCFRLKAVGKRGESIFAESGLIFTSGRYPVDLRSHLFTTVSTREAWPLLIANISVYPSYRRRDIKITPSDVFLSFSFMQIFADTQHPQISEIHPLFNRWTRLLFFLSLCVLACEILQLAKSSDSLPPAEYTRRDIISYLYG